METMSYIDNQSVVSDITDIFSENFDSKIEEIKIKLNNDLNKLNIDLLKDKCKELGINGLSKLKKPELIQLLESEFFKMQTYLNSKSKNDLKNLCKMCDVKKVSTSKKDELVYQILFYNANNMIFRMNDNVQTQLSDNLQPLSPIELLEKQKQEIEQQLQEEIKKKEEEAKRLLEEEEKKRQMKKKSELKKKKRKQKRRSKVFQKMYVLLFGIIISERILLNINVYAVRK